MSFIEQLDQVALALRLEFSASGVGDRVPNGRVRIFGEPIVTTRHLHGGLGNMPGRLQLINIEGDRNEPLDDLEQHSDATAA